MLLSIEKLLVVGRISNICWLVCTMVGRIATAFSNIVHGCMLAQQFVWTVVLAEYGHIIGTGTHCSVQSCRTNVIAETCTLMTG